MLKLLKQKHVLFGSFEFLSFGIVSDFGFRASNFTKPDF